MNAVEVYLLGRKLMKIAESALPSGGLPASVRMVLVDISEHPDSSIGQITARTGFPQSHVSASVARLREQRVIETSVDASDGRRTLVRINEGIRDQLATRAPVPIGGVLAAELRSSDPDDLVQATDALEALAEVLIPRALHRLRMASAADSEAG